MKAPLALTFGMSVALLTNGTAQAHAKLVSADPSMGGVAHAAPHTLDLRFSEEISGKLSGATVKGPDGKLTAVSVGVGKDGKSMTVTPKQPLKRGVYSVAWHAVASDDGHRTAGAYKFTVD